jgi:hypothetical protein
MIIQYRSNKEFFYDMIFVDMYIESHIYKILLILYLFIYLFIYLFCCVLFCLDSNYNILPVACKQNGFFSLPRLADDKIMSINSYLFILIINRVHQKSLNVHIILLPKLIRLQNYVLIFNLCVIGSYQYIEI